MEIIKDQEVWQVGTGDNTRDYSQTCLDFGIAMVGPGWPGNALENPVAYKNESDWGIMLTKVKIGNIVLLRRGQTIIKAVGEVVDSYKYSESLSNVNGWDLNHYITVKWFVCKNGKDIVLPHAMIGYSTMSKVGKRYEKIKRIINSHEYIEYKSKRKLASLKIPKEVSIEDLKNHFIEYGIRIGDAINIAETIEKIIILVKWYRENDPKVLEHELRSFLVIPFLLSLGWSEQKIKIEYYKIDIALFKRPYTKDSNQEPALLIETKAFDDGLDLAKDQIKDYIQEYPNCRIMVTTNGYRYNIYTKNNNEMEIFSSFDLLDMREFAFLENSIRGVLDGIIKLSNY